MKKPNWQSHKRGSVSMHVYESAVTGFAKYYKKFFNLEFSELLNYFDDELVYWCWDLNMMQEFAVKYSKVIQNETQNEFMNKWIKLASQLMKISLEINNLDLNNLSNYEKYKLYQKIHLSSEKFHTYSATSIDFMDEFLPSIVENEYKKLPIKFQNSVNHKILTSLFDLSVVAQKEIDLLKLKINKISIDEFYSKYFWINCGFSDWPIYSKKEINNNLSEIKLSPNKIEQKINSIYHDVDANKLIKKKLLDKIANQKFTNLINFADTMVFYHDDRKKHQMISIMAMNRILKSIKEYNFNDLLWCKGSEIAEYLRTGKN